MMISQLICMTKVHVLCSMKMKDLIQSFTLCIIDRFTLLIDRAPKAIIIFILAPHVVIIFTLPPHVVIIFYLQNLRNLEILHYH